MKKQRIVGLIASRWRQFGFNADSRDELDSVSFLMWLGGLLAFQENSAGKKHYAYSQQEF